MKETFMNIYLVTWAYGFHSVSANNIKEALDEAVKQFGDPNNITEIKKID